MTSKSLKRARHKAALKQKADSEAAGAQPAGKTHGGLGGSSEGTVVQRRDWPRAVSEAMVASKWAEALTGLRRMRACGQVGDITVCETSANVYLTPSQAGMLNKHTRIHTIGRGTD